MDRPRTRDPKSPEAAPESGRRIGTRFLWSVAALLLFLSLAAGFALVVVQTEWGTRLLWRAAPGLLPGQLSGDWAGGTLSEGLALRNLVYQDKTQQIRIDRLEVKWRLSRSPLKLSIRYLRLGTVDVSLLPTPDEPRKLPQKLTLPLALDLKKATVRDVILRSDGQVARYRDIRLRASSDRVNHALFLENAVTPFGTADGSLRLNGNRPFKLAGKLELQGEYQKKNYRAAADLSGSLQALGIKLQASGMDANAQANIDATPFADVPFRSAKISVDRLDPKAINPGWPEAQLQLRAALSPTNVTMDPAELVVSGPVTLSNAKPGPIDQGRLPLVSVQTLVTLDAKTQQLSQISIQLPGKAFLEGGGAIHNGTSGKFTVQAHALDLQKLHTTLRPTRLNGPFAVTLSGATQRMKLSLSDPASFSIVADAQFSPKRMTLHSGEIKSGAAQLKISGDLARETSEYSVNAALSDFNPGIFLSSMQKTKAGTPAKKSGPAPLNARINMEFKAEGALRPELTTQVRFDIHDSTYADLPMTGGGFLRVAGKRILPSDAGLKIAGNEMNLKGSFGQPGNRLRVYINAPALARLGFGVSGLLQVDGDVSGTFSRPLVDARYKATSLVFGENRLASLAGAATITGVPGTNPNAKTQFTLNARGLQSSIVRLARASVAIDGSYARHQIRINADGQLRGQKLDMALNARGRLQEKQRGLAWDGVIGTLENRGLPRFSLLAPLALSVAPGQVNLGAARLSIAKAMIDLKHLRLNDQLIDSEGTFDQLNVGHLLALRQQFTGATAPVDTNLVLDGRWKFALADRANGFFEVKRRSGDIDVARVTGAAGSRLGLTALSLRTDLQGKRALLDINANATRIGKLDGKAEISLQARNGRLAFAADAPLSGRIHALIPRLQTIASLAGPRVALDGTVAIRLAVNGTPADPRVSGQVTGDRLSLTLYDQGVRLQDGTARITVDNNIAELRQVEFHGGEGTLRAMGRIPLDQKNQDIHATIVADRLQLLAGPAGQMTVSGQAKAANVNQQLQVTGKFVVDQALFNLPEKAAPKLDDDVVIIRSTQPQAKAPSPATPAAGKPAGPFTPHINIDVDLGNRFRFEGSGAELRLAGTLAIASAPNEPLQVFGTVRIVDGTYTAFGTELQIERGLINFQGPSSTPNVNILAMRRGQEVAAGVQVTGTVQQPRVQLVSDPNVSEEEKLSWLVFGRGGGSSEPGQAQAAAEGAAMGLLNKFGGARIANRLGLDEFSIGSSDFGSEGQQVANIGKEITDRLFIGFEQSLSGTGSVLKLTYELTQNWSAVVRGGTVTGLDLFYNKRFDQIGAKEK